MLDAKPVALAVASTSCVAPTSTAPVPCTVRDEATDAVFVMSIQLTAIAAATPTLPPELPDWPDAWPLPCVAWLFADGSVPVLPPLFGFLFTELSACVSAFAPDDDSPFALACTSLPASTVDVEVIVMAPALVMSRLVVAAVFTRTTVTPMIAPTAALLPAAAPSPE